MFLAHYACSVSKRAAKITKDELEAVVETADNDILSIRSLIAKQDSSIIITDPREYQVELFEKAKKQNIIAVLDTGMCDEEKPRASQAENLQVPARL